MLSIEKPIYTDDRFKPHYVLPIKNGSVLEIGAGFRPFIVLLDIMKKQRRWEHKETYEPFREFDRRSVLHGIEISKCAQYTGIELCQKFLEKAHLVTKKCCGPLKRKINLVQGDGRKLSFTDSLFDLVIFSDVLSIPPHDCCMGDCSFNGATPLQQPHHKDCGCDPDDYYDEEVGGCDCAPTTCKGEVFPGCSDEDKQKMLDEAIRVLRPGGHLWNAMRSTPGFAEVSRAYLSHHKALTSREELWAARYSDLDGDVYFYGSIEIFQKR